MDNTKIDWATASWNPITGCLHGCEYCYARGIAKRFGKSDGAVHALDKIFAEEFNEPIPGKLHELDSPVYYGGKVDPYPYGFDPTFHRYHLDKPQHWKKPRNIFVISMGDLFGEWVPLSWIEDTFEACESAPWHNYLFLTKNPSKMCDVVSEYQAYEHNNWYFGTTITENIEGHRVGKLNARGNAFVSIEPIKGEIILCAEYVKWVIIGAESGNSKDKIIPRREWVADIVDQCRAAGVPVFLKGSLSGIWGEPLIQEYPQELLTNAHSG